MQPRFLFTIILTYLFMHSISAQEQPNIINNSNIAFTVAEKDLLPESIAYDTLKNQFYIGSTRKGKIIRVLPNGTHENFILPKQYGLWMIIGMEIDVERRHLWVCSSGGSNLEGYNYKDNIEGRPAGIFKFDLDSGKLIKKYVLNNPGEVHFFNDIVVAQNGDVYITHMFTKHGLYKITSKKDILENVFFSNTYKFPNGLTLSQDESKLFIAHSNGISIYDITQQKTKEIEVPKEINISKNHSIDGLYYYNNSLIGIQPDLNTVLQFKLDKTGSKILSADPLEVNHPMMNNPTTGEVINGSLYYVANAQFGSFNKDGSLFSSEKLYEVCILQLPLDIHQSKNEHHE
ncbi:SMP-30/gluconolactonase/LRE family protein [Aquimarina sp. D1M17]|uniref:SMP-30/gluconolactonase/LRE family protein n=1 Tax=Aquimarina acroporae TaxID=2937283 RepID=UPI0020BE417A|nr:SMP-30/gluconolactonase/LRE family protein [Aquimarina acroporae]MCK8523110.1 SMP-30/gluconolactonase/LRE family protein [Aquimarina acroporae]